MDQVHRGFVRFVQHWGLLFSASDVRMTLDTWHHDSVTLSHGSHGSREVKNINMTIIYPGLEHKPRETQIWGPYKRSY